MKKITLTVGLTFCLLGLVACKAKNPLEGKNKERVATFLTDASQYAESKLNAKQFKAKLYEACIKGIDVKINCNKVYDAMVEFSKKDGRYSGLAKEHLTDKPFYSSIKADYERLAFNIF
jgi:hypothetical protein